MQFNPELVKIGQWGLQDTTRRHAYMQIGVELAARSARPPRPLNSCRGHGAVCRQLENSFPWPSVQSLCRAACREAGLSYMYFDIFFL